MLNALWASSITIIWLVTSMPRAFLEMLDSNRLYGKQTSWFSAGKAPELAGKEPNILGLV